MPFLLAEILNFQGSTHLRGVGSFSNLFCSLDICIGIFVEIIVNKYFKLPISFCGAETCDY